MLYLYVIVLAIFVYLYYTKVHSTPIKKLVRQTARYATAAQQDDADLVALLHSNYASGYLQVLKDFATPQEIHNETGIDFKKFENSILQVQDSVTRRALKNCPQFSGEVNKFIGIIAGEA